MYSPEQSALRESPKEGRDSGLGITDAISQGFEDSLKEMRKAQCAFLNAKPAEAVLPKCEVKEEDGKKFLEFAAIADKQNEAKTQNLDQWLDGKTKLRPQAA